MGAYGTNEGDIWLGEGSPIQDMLDRDGEGFKLIHEMMRNQETGQVEEHIYITDNAEMIVEAEEGTKRYWDQKTREN